MARRPQAGSLIWRRLFKRFEARELSLQSQLRETIVNAVFDGIIKPGDPLPSSRWFAHALQISRTTVSLALQRLCDAGTIVSRPRSGLFVNPDLTPVRLPDGGPTRGQPESAAPAKPPTWVTRIPEALARQRNIVKPRNWQQYPYPFIYGQFDPQLFPFAEWRQCTLDGLHKGEVARWAPDHIDQDSEALVAEIQAHLLPARGIWVERDNILVTAGAQNALFLLAALLLDATTTIGIEEPGYPDARNIFLMHTRRVVPLPVDASGLLIDRAIDRCRYVFATPSHQCPTTVTMTLERRHALLARARQRDVVIIEDDHESELNHLGMPTPALKSLDTDERVIYVGSLSKTLAHGLRLGYVVGPTRLIGELRRLRRLMMRHPSMNNEQTAATFIRRGHHESFLRRLNRAYRERAAIARDALARHLSQAHCVPAQGGSALWVKMPARIDTRELANRALAQGVVVEAGDVFFARPGSSTQHLRLGFSSIDARRIEPGIRLLAQLVEAY